jgi:predicted nucleotidyltransferase/DNA-binding XRE family transcriptional regulator
MSADPEIADAPVVAAELIRDARRRADLTQVELAVRAGLTQSVISTYENGRREPSLVALQRLLRAAGFVWRIELEPVADPPSLRSILDRHRDELVRAVAELGGRNPRLFGSVARGDDRPGSDIDLMVDLEPGCGLFALMRMQDEAERILGTKVDVVSAGAMSPRTRAAAVRDAVAL